MPAGRRAAESGRRQQQEKAYRDRQGFIVEARAPPTYAISSSNTRCPGGLRGDADRLEVRYCLVQEFVKVKSVPPSLVGGSFTSVTT